MEWESDADSVGAVAVRWDEGSFHHRALLDVDGGPLLVLRTIGGPCEVYAAMRGDEAAIAVAFEYGGARGEVTILRARVRGVTGVRSLALWGDSGVDVTRLRVSPTQIVAAVSTSVATVSAHGSLAVISTPYFPASAEAPHILGEEVCFLVDSPQRMIVCAAPGAEPRIVRAEAERQVTSLSRDGERLVWIETHDDPATGLRRVELWTGSLEGDLADARMVRELPSEEPGAAGAGLFVHLEPDVVEGAPRHAIYRLADGARATFASPEGATVAGVGYVGETDVLLGQHGRVIRIDPRTLTFE